MPNDCEGVMVLGLLHRFISVVLPGGGCRETRPSGSACDSQSHGSLMAGRRRASGYLRAL